MTNTTIRPGTKVLVEVGGLDQKANSRFVGMVAGRFIILQFPAVPEVNRALWRDYLYANNEITVRFMDEGIVLGFKSRIVKTITSPYPLLFIECPEDMETYNLRKAKRVSCLFQSTMHLGDRQMLGMLSDLSTGGCLVTLVNDGQEGEGQGDVPGAVGDEALLECSYFEAAGDDRIPCTIQRVKASGRKVELGLKFDRLAPGVSRNIEEYVGQALSISDV